MDSPFKMDYLLDVDAAYRLFYSQGAQGNIIWGGVCVCVLPSGGIGMRDGTSLFNRAHELEDIMRLFGGVS